MVFPGTSPRARAGLYNLPKSDLPTAFEALNADFPLLMLPVRLETRFYRDPHRLRIRIYPDQIHVNSHQPALSEREARLGQRFWELVWRRGQQNAPRIFERLAQQVSVWRAAWVMQATTPLNVDKLGRGQPEFPPIKTGREEDAPSRIELLPKRWLAVGYLDGEALFVEHGELIPDKLRFAPFQMDGPEDVHRWMVNFDAALRVGMAIEVKLKGSKQRIINEGLDELIVVGTRLDEKPGALAQALEDNLQAHYFVRGFDFLPQGTPTNNTETVSSPWQWNEGDSAAILKGAWRPGKAQNQTYRARFARTLGLDDGGIAARAAHADTADLPGMEAMNHALWYVTWGEYLRFMLNDGEKSILSDDALDWARDWFVDHVRGGAIVPAFHIGAVPYGVLPVQLQPVPQDAHTGEEYLQWALWHLRAGWERSLPNVPHLDPAATASATDAPVTTDLEGANENLVALLSSHPHPAKFFIRNLYNVRTVLFGLFDPVFLVDALVDRLIESAREVDNAWGVGLDIELADPFDTLAAQTHYFEDLLAEVDDRIESLSDQIKGVSGPVLPGLAQQIEQMSEELDIYQNPQGGIRSIVEQIVFLLSVHAGRVAPLRDLGLPTGLFSDVLSESPPSPEHFFFHYRDTATEWGGLPLVQAPDAAGGASAPVYLAWLRDYAAGSAQGDKPNGLPDPPPLLYQLIRRSIDRARAWDNEPVADLLTFLGDMDRIGKMPSSAARVSETKRVAANRRMVANTAGTLNALLKRPASDPVRSAVARIPKTAWRSTAAQLRAYRRVNPKAAPRVKRVLTTLDTWIAQPDVVETGPLEGIDRLDRVPVQARQRLNALADAVGVLVDLPAGELELRMRETLGLAMHRLDAWITAYAGQRVGELRRKNPTGIQIGGFGWVENLRPDEAGAAASQGYIHAPSMTQAATAAVLRSGYSAYSDGTSTSPFAIDLRSDRVRVARWIMDGVRQGQRLNDLLGYRFERYLHDHNLDIWIDAVRDVVSEHGTTELAGSNEMIVVDGLALLELWGEGDGTLGDVMPEVTDAANNVQPFSELEPALAHLAWITDALADLTLAESVHAVVQGDYERASAVQNASALGDVPPPEVRSVLTPNSGMTITHKVVLVPQGEASTWNQASTVRGSLEPELEAWAAGIVGPPERVIYRVRGGEDDPPETRSLADLNLAALDAIYLAPPGKSVGGSGLGAHIALDYRQRYATPEHPIPDVTTEADAPIGKDQISLAEFILLANSVRSALGGARPATGADFVLGTQEGVPGVDVGEMEGRAKQLIKQVDRLVNTLAAGQNVMKTLMALSTFNLPEAVPTSRDSAALAEQAAAVLRTAQPRLEEARASLTPPQGDAESSTADARLRRAQAAIASIMGRGFPAMPRFQAPLKRGWLRDESELGGGDPHTAMGWLLKMARVRPDLGALRDTITTAEALQDRALFPLWVAQVPHDDHEPWAGLTRPNDTGQDRLSLVMTTNGDARMMAGVVGGLVFDQWSERIPTDYEMTGLTFHFDAPTSRPPQALLLALPPAGEAWDFELIVATVREAFALARLRAVAPETLDDYGQQIPAVYLTSKLDTTGPNSEA